MTLFRADRRRSQLAAVAVLTVFAALLRFPTLDRQSFWSDEAMTALLARMSFTDMLSTIGDTESTPPLYYVLAWVWAKTFGYGEVGVRSFSALAGTVTVPVTYLAGSKLLEHRPGLAAAGLVTVSPLLFWYSQEARTYALAVLLCGVSFAALTYVLERATTGSLTVWAGASVLAISSHYFALFVVGAEVLWLVAVVRRPVDPVAPAQRSQVAKAKAQSKRTAEGFPAHSFRDLLTALSTLTRNRVRLRGAQASFEQLAQATPFQSRAFELLEVNPSRL